MHFLGPFVVIAVVLLPVVNLYPSFSSLSSPSFALHCWARACLWWVRTWVVSSLCGACARASVSLLVPCALASVLASVSSFLCCFPGLQSSLLLVLSPCSIFPLSFFRPRAALPVGISYIDVPNS